MASFVEVFQIEGVVPYLIDPIAGVVAGTHLEFQHEQDLFKDEHGIDTQAEAWNVVLEKQRSVGRGVRPENALKN